MDIMHVMITPLALMGVMGGVFGVLLAIASIVFRVHQDDRIGKIRAALPGANCGGCGYPGCDGYAAGVVNDGAAVNKCNVGGAPVAEIIASIMGVQAGANVPMRTFLKCKGTCEASPRKLTYEGVHDCRSASMIPGGSPNSCPFGCIGLGTCVSVCVFGALSIGEDGLPKVDLSKCVGCGTCVANCPKGVLTLIPRTADVVVACNSHWKGPMVKSVCSAGCIGCTLCEKKCPKKAITMVNDLAVINQDLCVKCGICAKVCPAKVISMGEKCAVVEKSA